MNDIASDTERPEAPPVLNGLLQAKPAELAMREGRKGFTLHGEPLAIFRALAKAKAEFKTIERTRLVKVRSEKGSYDFWYAPLEGVIAAVDEALSKHGLAQFQPLVKEGNVWVLRTILAHESGSYIECVADLAQAGADNWQKLGGAITYCRRYMLGSLLGVAPDEDDDGTTAEGMHRDTETKGPPARQSGQAKPPDTRPKATEKPKEAPKDTAKEPEAKPAPAGEPEAPKDTSGPVTSGVLAKIGSLSRGRLFVTPEGQQVIFTRQLIRDFSTATIGKLPFIETDKGIEPNTDVTMAEGERLLKAFEALPLATRGAP